MRISLKSMMYGVLVYLAFEVWVTSLSILEIANQNTYLVILGTVGPLVMVGATLTLAVLAVVIPWDWLEEML